jgi:hypothetical protein
VAVEVYPSDYRKAGEILVPHKSTQRMMGITQVAEFSSITFNQSIPDEKFSLPPDVRPLVERGAAKAGKQPNPGRREADSREKPPRP